MKECMIFPRDPGTLEIINQIEAYFGLQHKNINEISNFKVHQYIDELAVLLYVE